ncbi:hypothetical protein ACMSFO_13430, partial [Bacteroides thetaiotaomicron]|uniref:hypothetical protein n=1 Tax=Bacteroides thetaiotaomicron TaxID=818 RepID=UPI0039C0C758
YLMRKTDRIVDVLYASGINSSQKATQPDPNWKSIRVFDKSMLQGLTENKGEDWMDRLLYTTTNSVYNASNVFFCLLRVILTWSGLLKEVIKMEGEHLF